MRAFVVVGLVLISAGAFAAEYAPIPRVLPPPGIEIPAEKREAWSKELAELRKRVDRSGASAEDAADVEVFLKAVSFAIELGEFYDPKDFAKADELLKVAKARTDELARGKTPWEKDHGLVVRGFVSRVDGAVQPYGLVIPEPDDKSPETPRQLIVFLHGRGDKQTDLHFIVERLKKRGEIAPEKATAGMKRQPIILHPFGRQCVGFKSAGETDVLEAVHDVCKRYRIHPTQIVLMGFSMGGAGAWHLGAHFADEWQAVSPGAGFAETARYTKTDPAKVPWYEQKLWGCYDVPCSVRTLFNTTVIAYSGELDKQIQAARVMEEAFKAEGRQLDHRIGPGVEHKYEPKTLDSLLHDVVRGSNTLSPEKQWQGRTLRYPGMGLKRAVQNLAEAPIAGVNALEEHWSDSRLIPTASGIETKNIRVFTKHRTDFFDDSIRIDGQEVKLPANEPTRQWVTFVRRAEGWTLGEFPPKEGRYKIPGLQGPIDDAFLEPFLIVTPSGQSPHADFAKWAKFEADHFIERWTGLMRGKPRVKVDREVTDEDLKQYHVVCWGDPESNSLVARMKDKLPVTFTANEFEMRGKKYARNAHAPVLIYPNPLWPKRYVVLNSGLTFREAHDRTNSQQNPKLPDWAVVDLSEPPSASAPGTIADAGFFDEEWRFKKEENRGP